MKVSYLKWIADRQNIPLITMTVGYADLWNWLFPPAPKPPADYVQNSDSDHNCYSYAFGLRIGTNPGKMLLPPDSKYDMLESGKLYTLKDATRWVLRDMEMLGRTARVVNSPTDNEEGEYVVAMKLSTQVTEHGVLYHLARQLSDGTWADKKGSMSSSWNNIDGTADTWDYYWWVLDSESVYFAIRE